MKLPGKVYHFLISYGCPYRGIFLPKLYYFCVTVLRYRVIIIIMYIYILIPKSILVIVTYLYLHVLQIFSVSFYQITFV